MVEYLLEVCDLLVEFYIVMGMVKVVQDVSWYLDWGEILVIFGEFGLGKLVLVLVVMNLIDMLLGKIILGMILLNGCDMLSMMVEECCRVNGVKIVMIF